MYFSLYVENVPYFHQGRTHNFVMGSRQHGLWGRAVLLRPEGPKAKMRFLGRDSQFPPH